MIKNKAIYILTILLIIILGWFYQEKENISLGLAFYIIIPILLYGVFYYAEKSLEKILIYFTTRNRWKILYLMPLGLMVGLCGDYLDINLIKSFGGIIVLFSLFVFLFWKRICKELEKNNENNSQQ